MLKFEEEAKATEEAPEGNQTDKKETDTVKAGASKEKPKKAKSGSADKKPEKSGKANPSKTAKKEKSPVKK